MSRPLTECSISAQIKIGLKLCRVMTCTRSMILFRRKSMAIASTIVRTDFRRKIIAKICPNKMRNCRPIVILQITYVIAVLVLVTKQICVIFVRQPAINATESVILLRPVVRQEPSTIILILQKWARSTNPTRSSLCHPFLMRILTSTRQRRFLWFEGEILKIRYSFNSISIVNWS